MVSQKTGKMLIAGGMAIGGGRSAVYIVGDLAGNETMKEMAEQHPWVCNLVGAGATIFILPKLMNMLS